MTDPNIHHDDAFADGELRDIEARLGAALGAGPTPIGLADRVYEASVRRAVLVDAETGEIDPVIESLCAALPGALAVAAPAGLADRVAAATTADRLVEQPVAVVGRIGFHRWAGRLAMAAAVALVGVVTWMSLNTVQPPVESPVATLDEVTLEMVSFLADSSSPVVDADMLAMGVEMDEMAMRFESAAMGESIDDTDRLMDEMNIVLASFESY